MFIELTDSQTSILKKVIWGEIGASVQAMGHDSRPNDNDHLELQAELPVWIPKTNLWCISHLEEHWSALIDQEIFDEVFEPVDKEIYDEAVIAINQLL